MTAAELLAQLRATTTVDAAAWFIALTEAMAS